MDEIDFATERAEAFTEVAIQAVRRRSEGRLSTGICSSCGDEIEELRLRANPHASHCRECASEEEERSRRSRLFGPR